LGAALRDMEDTEKLHEEQERALKSEIRELERAKKREGLNIDYLKAVVVNFLTSAEQQSMLPVLAQLLQFSPEDISKVNEKYNEGFIGNVTKYWYSSPRKP
jgi:NADH:ubiquinone oxidoreductase subunit E